MTVAQHNWEWEQGEDLVMKMVYKTGALSTPVDLTNYKLRMDIFSDTARVFVFNSHDINGDPALDNEGSADNEATLGSDGKIVISIGREHTLPGGLIGQQVAAGKLVFNYDIFLRDGNDKQFKFLTGTIKINKSYTLWA